MIKNERQYRITKASAEKFRKALASIADAPLSDPIHPLLRKAHEDSIGSQLEELESDLSDYESLKTGKQSVLDIESFDELPQALIRARIAAGISQRELAVRLGLKQQQIQHYESTDYASASLSRILEVMNALQISVRSEITLLEIQVADAGASTAPTTAVAG